MAISSHLCGYMQLTLQESLLLTLLHSVENITVLYSSPPSPRNSTQWLESCNAHAHSLLVSSE